MSCIQLFLWSIYGDFVRWLRNNKSLSEHLLWLVISSSMMETVIVAVSLMAWVYQSYQDICFWLSGVAHHIYLTLIVTCALQLMSLNEKKWLWCHAKYNSYRLCWWGRFGMSTEESMRSNYAGTNWWQAWPSGRQEHGHHQSQHSEQAPFRKNKYICGVVMWCFLPPLNHSS